VQLQEFHLLYAAISDARPLEQQSDAQLQLAVTEDRKKHAQALQTVAYNQNRLEQTIQCKQWLQGTVSLLQLNQFVTG